MTFGAYIWSFRFVTLVSLLVFGALLFMVDPDEAGVGLVGAFFLSLSGVISGVLLAVLARLYRKHLGEEGFRANRYGLMRQGILLALFLPALLALRFFHILNWWSALLLVALMLLLEFTGRQFSHRR